MENMRMSGDKEFEFGLGDGRRIVGVIERPQATLRGWAIVAHCFSCGQDGLAAVRLSRALARSGVGVLRFDFAGAGDRDGLVADASFELIGLLPDEVLEELACFCSDGGI
jgi:putative redox protein